jgi:hypothetical protein
MRAGVSSMASGRAVRASTRGSLPTERVNHDGYGPLLRSSNPRNRASRRLKSIHRHNPEEMQDLVTATPQERPIASSILAIGTA